MLAFRSAAAIVIIETKMLRKCLLCSQASLP
jgi:hypothetical protein